MNLLNALWWLLTSALSLAWSLVWLLIGGWVSTALQLIVVVGVIFGLKYGWRQVPAELWRHALWVSRWVWWWLWSSGKSAQPALERARSQTSRRGSEGKRGARRKEPGDVNISTLLSLSVLALLALWGAAL